MEIKADKKWDTGPSFPNVQNPVARAGFGGIKLDITQDYDFTLKTSCSG
jgi:hypothetical protein